MPERELAIIACDNLALRGSVPAACPQAPKGLRSTYGTFIHPRKHPLSGLFLRSRGQPTISRQHEPEPKPKRRRAPVARTPFDGPALRTPNKGKNPFSLF